MFVGEAGQMLDYAWTYCLSSDRIPKGDSGKPLLKVANMLASRTRKQWQGSLFTVMARGWGF